MPIEEGKAAPQFTLKDQDGKNVSLSEFLGRYVVVYFYPADDTPGCTKQACGFRALWKDYEAANIAVLGISPDDEASHREFIEKFQLPFTLLCDPEKEVMAEYGAWGEKMMYGKKKIGVIRSTVLVDPAGNVVKHWKRVAKAESHAEKVLQVISASA
ncbi:MAG: peroxiredoxin Q/BCP [Parasphingorhabdus sp.]|jgi:peroxiredoxin Q/BCP